MNYWFGIPSLIIGIPATVIPLYVWATFIDTRRGK